MPDPIPVPELLPSASAPLVAPAPVPEVLAEQVAGVSGSDLTGLTIKNRYTLWELIGTGLQAQAYLAYDNLLEGKVVVKVLSTEIEGIPLPLPDDWEQEAKKAMQVRNCPYIASVTDFGEEALTLRDGSTREVAFIVWEYVKGITLEELGEEGADLTLEFLLELAQQLTQVLHILNETNLIHGDLHSKNILMDRVSSGKPLIKVIDFGLSHQNEGGRQAHRDGRSAHRILNQLIEQRRAALPGGRFTEREQEFAAIVAQLGTESEEEYGIRLARIQSALDQLARRHLATTPMAAGFESIDQLFPWSQTVLAQAGSYQALPLIGRQEPLQQVLGHLTYAYSAGQGTIVLLRGESGAGKKRLAWEALHEFCLAHHEVFLLAARGHRGSTSAPFSAIRQMLRQFLGEERTADYPRLLGMLLADSQPLVAPLVEFLQEERTGTSTAQDLPVTAMAHLIAKALARMSLLRPLLLWVSDLQYVDEASRHCLLHVARDAARFPLVLLGTYAPGELESAGGQQALFENWQQALRELGGCIEVPVRALPQPQVAEFLAAALPWRNIPADHPLVQTLWQHSGGNPHLLQESLAYLRQSGIIEADPSGGWHIDTGALQELGAASIQWLLERRLLHLDPFQREVLDLAACWGLEFPEDKVTALFAGREIEATAALYTAQELGLLIPGRGGILTFQPFALWEVLCNDQPPDRLQRNHRQVAEALSRQLQGLQSREAILDLACHWEAAGDPQRALETYLQGAERAVAVRANEAALEACHRATHLINMSGLQALEAARLLAQCHLLQAKAYRYLGDLAAQEEYAVKAFEGAVVARDQHLELRALKAIGEYYRAIADYDGSTDYFRQGLEIARGLNDRSRTARFHKEIGVNHYLLGDMEAAETEYQEAIRLNQEIGDAEGLARVYNNLGMICRNRGDWTQAKEWFERAIAHFQEVQEAPGLVLPMGNMAIIYTEEGEYEKAMILLKELLREEGKIGEARLLAKIRVTLGDVQSEIGEDADALQNYEHSLTVYRALGDRQGECEVLTNIASMYYEEGKLELAERFHQIGLELKREIGYEWGIPLDYYDLARVSLARQDHATALECLLTGKEIAKRLRMHELEFSLEVLEVHALEIRGDVPDKQLLKHYDRLMELYPEVQRSMTTQRQLTFLVQAGRFYRSHGEPNGETLLQEARQLLRQLAGKLLRAERKQRFWAKYRRLFPDLELPETVGR